MTVNLGQLSDNAQSISGSANSTETNDLYSFSLGNTSNLNLSLTGLSADADLQVYQDNNGNKAIDSSDTFITRSANGGNSDESINVADLNEGNYLAQVYQFSGDTDYLLGLSASTPSNLLPTEVEIGTLSGSQDFSGFVGSEDTTDVYHFSFDTDNSFNLTLGGLSADADVRLIQDTNNNLIVDSGEVLVTSSNGGTLEDSIDTFLSAGDNYFVQVYQYSGDTFYTI